MKKAMKAADRQQQRADEEQRRSPRRCPTPKKALANSVTTTAATMSGGDRAQRDRHVDVARAPRQHHEGPRAAPWPRRCGSPGGASSARARSTMRARRLVSTPSIAATPGQQEHRGDGGLRSGGRCRWSRHGVHGRRAACAVRGAAILPHRAGRVRHVTLRPACGCAPRVLVVRSFNNGTIPGTRHEKRAPAPSRCLPRRSGQPEPAGAGSTTTRSSSSARSRRSSATAGRWSATSATSPRAATSTPSSSSASRWW